MARELSARATTSPRWLWLDSWDIFARAATRPWHSGCRVSRADLLLSVLARATNLPWQVKGDGAAVDLGRRKVLNVDVLRSVFR
ncbi:hypothetical protein TYRP_013661 [Tyrophagus putrescentiae]|nr:hypothetical protein TYRP_013661 [Tyrophagus putrescentiae]